MDAPKDHDGLGRSFSPTDLVATALGTCIATVMGIAAEKHGVDAPKRHLSECRLTEEEAEALEEGMEITVDIFGEGQRVDAIGTSKGRGMTGVVKRHGFAIKKRSHGTHEFFRHGGSIGAGADPGKVIKGKKMPGQYGNVNFTVENLTIVDVKPEENLILIRGALPGNAEIEQAITEHLSLFNDSHPELLLRLRQI